MLAQIVTQANENRVVIDDLQLRRPGLEDAFLAITGEHIEDAGEAA
jgi:hypothetical protein